MNIRAQPCPVVGCGYKSTRLDKHLGDGHSELSRDAVLSNLEEARRRKAITLLAALRATNPHISMASTLDIDVDEGDEVGFAEGAPMSEEETGEAGCANPDCRDKLASWIKGNGVLTKKVQSLEKELASCRRLVKQQARKLARLAGTAATPRDTGGKQGEEDEEEDDDEPLREEPADDEPPALSPAPAPAAAAPAETDRSKPLGKAAEQEEQAGPSQKEGRENMTIKRLFGGQGRSAGMRHLTFPTSIANYLNDYQAHHEGSCPTAKQLENAFSKVSRVKTFVYYMAQGKTELYTWRFIDDVQGIREWANYIGGLGKTVTTANFYLRNVYQFVKYMKETPPPLCRLSQAQLTGVVRAVKQALTNITRKVVLHQMSVKAKKLSKVISRESLRSCQEKAKLKIPELLTELEADPLSQVRYKFYGYMSALIACIYGHRPGVLCNLTVEEVKAAKAGGNPEEGYVISIDNHKTNKHFGAAQIFVEPDEYGWLERWLAVREENCPPNNLVFFTAGKGPVKNLMRYMQGAWEEMGLPGKPNFTDIRTAVSAHAKNFHTGEVRKKIATFMCHNTATADRFYSLNLSVAQSREMRRHFEDALVDPASGTPSTSAPPSSSSLSSSRKKTREPELSESDADTDSSDEGEVPYQESGSSGLEEEKRDVEEEKAFVKSLENTPSKSPTVMPKGKHLKVTLSPLQKVSKKISDRSRRAAFRSAKRRKVEKD